MNQNTTSPAAEPMSDIDFVDRLAAAGRTNGEIESPPVAADDARDLAFAGELFAARVEPPPALAQVRWIDDPASPVEPQPRPVEAMRALIRPTADHGRDRAGGARQARRWNLPLPMWIVRLSRLRLAEAALVAVILALGGLLYGWGPGRLTMQDVTTDGTWNRANEDGHGRRFPPERPAGVVADSVDPFGNAGLRELEMIDTGANGPTGRLAVDHGEVYVVAGNEITYYRNLLSDDAAHVVWAGGDPRSGNKNLHSTKVLESTDRHTMTPERNVVSSAIDVESGFGVLIHTGEVVDGDVTTLVSRLSILDPAAMRGDGPIAAADLDIGEVRSVALVAPYAFVTTGDRLAAGDSLRVLDVAEAREIGHLDGLGDVDEVIVQGGYAYVLDRARGIQMIDVRMPTAPRLVATLTDAGPPGDMMDIEPLDDGFAVLTKESVEVFGAPTGEEGVPSAIYSRPTDFLRSTGVYPSHLAVSGVEQSGQLRWTFFVAGPGLVEAITEIFAAGTPIADQDGLMSEGMSNPRHDLNRDPVRKASDIRAIVDVAAIDGMAYVLDDRGRLFVLDHLMSPYWAAVRLVVNGLLTPEGAVTVTAQVATPGSSTQTVNHDIEGIDGPLFEFSLKPANDPDADTMLTYIWLYGRVEILEKLGRLAFTAPINIPPGERTFEFNGPLPLDLPFPPELHVVNGPDAVHARFKVNQVPTDAEKRAELATFEAFPALPTRTPMPFELHTPAALGTPVLPRIRPPDFNSRVLGAATGTP